MLWVNLLPILCSEDRADRSLAVEDIAWFDWVDWGLGHDSYRLVMSMPCLWSQTISALDLDIWIELLSLRFQVYLLLLLLLSNLTWGSQMYATRLLSYILALVCIDLAYTTWALFVRIVKWVGTSIDTARVLLSICLVDLDATIVRVEALFHILIACYVTKRHLLL